MTSKRVGGASVPPTVVRANKYVPVNVFIRKTCGDKTMEKEFVKRIEYEEKVLDEIEPNYPLKTAEVTQSVSTKVSDSVYWGSGTWDKIPYSVEVFCSVKLMCHQSSEKIDMAKELAHDMACNSVREHMTNALAAHVTNIKTKLFKGLFE